MGGTILRRFVCFMLIILGLSAPVAVFAESPRADRLVITLAGDCTIGSEGQYVNAKSSFVQVVAEKGFDWPFSGVIDLFANDDLTLVNLEGTFTNAKRAREKRFTFRAPPEYADVLVLGSVEAVNMANNHSRDYLDRGTMDTKNALAARGIAYCYHYEPTVVEIKGRKIALLGISYPLRKSKVQGMREQIEAFRADPNIDLIIANFHAGIENTYKQRKDQITAAHQVIDSGADVVVGTHPHVLQGMEVYKGKPIFYSLGNFSFGGNNSPNDLETAVIQLEYDIGGEGKPQLVRLQVFPYMITEAPLKKVQDYRPVPAMNPANIASIFKKLSWGSSGLPEDFFQTGLWVIEN